MIKAGHETILETLKFHQYKEDLGRRLISVLKSEKSLMERLLKDGEKWNNIPKEIKDMNLLEAKNNSKDKKEIIDSYLKDQNKQFQPVILSVHLLKNLCNIYLTQFKVQKDQ